MDAVTFRIPIENDGLLIEKLKKLERTADRLAIPFPHVTLGQPYKTEKRDALSGVVAVHWWRPVTLEGEGIDRPVSYGGWKIIGQFNHEYPKVILNKLADNIKPEFIARFEENNVSFCEHCQKQIYRHNTYVIENEDTSEQMLIGSNCMHHYVPHQKSLDSIMTYYMSIHEMFGSEEDDELGSYRGEPKYEDTHEYLRSVFQVLLAGIPIKSDLFGPVLGHLRSGTAPKEKDSEVFEFLQKARDFKEDAESEMFHMMLFISALSEENEFNVRLKRMCEPGYHRIKDNNTVAWGASKYYDYIHRPRKPRTNVQTKWVGEVGDMLEVQVKFESRIFLYSSDYGDSYLFTFKTAEGDTITWKTSYMDTEFLQGDMILRGRVKELTEFKGVKQTQVTRAKLRKL